MRARSGSRLGFVPLVATVALLTTGGCTSSGPYWSREDQGAAEATELRERVASLEAQLAAVGERNAALQAKVEGLERELERTREGTAEPNPTPPARPFGTPEVPLAPGSRQEIEQSDLADLVGTEEPADDAPAPAPLPSLPIPLRALRPNPRGSMSAVSSFSNKVDSPKPRPDSSASWPQTPTPTSRTTRSSGLPNRPCDGRTSSPPWPVFVRSWSVSRKATRFRTPCSRSVHVSQRSATPIRPQRCTASWWHDSPTPPRPRPPGCASAHRNGLRSDFGHAANLKQMRGFRGEST